MTKRGIALLVSLIVLVFGVSAFTLVPVLLPGGSGSVQAVATTTGTADSLAGMAADVIGDDLSTGSSSSQTGSQAAKDAEGNSSGTTTGVDGGQSGDAQSSTGSRGSDSGGGGSGNSGSGSPGTSGSGSGGGGGSGGGSGGGGTSGTSGNTSGTSGTDSQQPSQQQPAATPQSTVMLSIDAETMGRGYIMSPRAVTFSEGETVFDVLSRECRNAGIPMEHSFYPLYNSAYIEGIDNLYQFDGGSQSGWMYSVNGWYPNYGCSAYVLSKGDVIKWRYTRDFGSDIGGSNALGS